MIIQTEFHTFSFDFLFRLMKSGINPFDSQEAKPYKNDPEILAMTNLVVSYQNNDINQFESILKQNRNNIMDDPFIREHIEDLLRNIRTQVGEIQKSCRPVPRLKVIELFKIEQALDHFMLNFTGHHYI